MAFNQITNPAWQPSDPGASLFLSKVAESDAGRTVDARPRPLDTSRRASPPSVSGEQHLRDRSNVYERALQRSVMLRIGNKQAQPSSLTLAASRGVGRLPGTTKSTYLATMKEADDGLEEEAEEDGWEIKMIKARGTDLELSQEEVARRDNGVLDMFQDVMRH